MTGCAENKETASNSAPTRSFQDYLVMGNNYADQQMYDQAEQAYKSAIMVNPADTRAHVNLAQLYIDSGRLQDAETILKVAVQVDPQETHAHNLLGNVYYARKSYNTARYHYQKALKANPDLYEAHWNMVGTCLMLKKDQEAFEHCRRYIELAPETEAHNIRRAKAYLSGQRP